MRITSETKNAKLRFASQYMLYKKDIFGDNRLNLNAFSSEPRLRIEISPVSLKNV